MQDVADTAGVALITVSRALRHPNQVSKQTRESIERAMEQLGYVPNLIAGGLAATATRIVSVIIPYIDHGVFADAVQGLSDVLENAGYCILLGNSGGSIEREETIIRMLLGHRPAAVVIQGANHTESSRRMLQSAGVPVVEIGTLPEFPIDISVGYSNFDAAYSMTRHLLEGGRRRIAALTLPHAHNDRVAARLAGYKHALAEAGIPLNERLLIEAPFALREGRLALERFMEETPHPDAVFCGSDSWAASMISECLRRGIKVPDDLAIAGFNDQPIADETVPSITTIRVPRYEVGKQAGRIILDRVNGKTSGPTRFDLGFELIRRQSA
jgi:LacI family gluconate utilization system Gnt-I transcriptional repressor